MATGYKLEYMRWPQAASSKDRRPSSPPRDTFFVVSLNDAYRLKNRLEVSGYLVSDIVVTDAPASSFVEPDTAYFIDRRAPKFDDTKMRYAAT